jgi:hypothetical protein
MLVRAMVVTLFTVAAHAALAQQGVEAWMAETRAQVLPLLPKVAKMMQDTVAAEGPVGAIPVCKEKAPSLLKEKADSLGWNIRRISLKPRNQQTGVADEWEAQQLRDFDTRMANGERFDKLERGEVVTDAQGRQSFRYIRAIPVAEVCLKCHGEPEKMSTELQTELKKNYPHDQALGYSLGQLRGALTVQRPL